MRDQGPEGDLTSHGRHHRDIAEGGLKSAVRGKLRKKSARVFSFDGSFIASSLSDDDSSGLEACHDGHLENNDI